MSGMTQADEPAPVPTGTPRWKVSLPSGGWFVPAATSCGCTRVQGSRGWMDGQVWCEGQHAHSGFHPLGLQCHLIWHIPGEKRGDGWEKAFRKIPIPPLGKPRAGAGEIHGCKGGKLLGSGTGSSCETLSFLASQAGTDAGEGLRGDVLHSQQSRRGLVLIRSDPALDLSRADGCDPPRHAAGGGRLVFAFEGASRARGARS